MNNSHQVEVLKALREVAKEREQPLRGPRLASVKVSPGSYLAAASVLTFSAALFLRSDQNLLALMAVGVAWLIVPFLALTDRIEFDGRILTRRGPMPFLLRLISGSYTQLSLEDFERVDTQTLRTLRRGGRVRYRYRTQILGKNARFTFASGGRSYREMVRQLFPLIHQDKLDLRTLELRDYLSDPKSLKLDVQALQLASDAVLDSATFDLKLGGRKRLIEPETGCAVSTVDRKRADLLGQVGNKLRIAGRLNEAREAFRRALLVLPTDGRLIFEFARLLRSQAATLSDARLLLKARAALRLSARRAGDDADLLVLVGESFLEWGDAARAQRSFHKVIDLAPENFRARMGLANLALRDGKLAHVIHQYRGAARTAIEQSLVVYAGREGDYYARLNDDDDYLASELQRINWLQHSLRVRRVAARATNASILAALIVPYLDADIGGLCWSLACTSIVAWISSLFAIRLLTIRRVPRAETNSVWS